MNAPQIAFHHPVHELAAALQRLGALHAVDARGRQAIARALEQVAEATEDDFGAEGEAELLRDLAAALAPRPMSRANP